MTEPTEQQLNDPQWWNENCEPWAQLVAIENDARGGFELMHQRASAHGSMIGVNHPDNDLTFYERPEPQSQEWDGKSWPIPVGVTVKNWRGEHRTVIVHDGSNIVCRCDDSGGYRGYSKGQATTHKLQPLRTKEQRDRDELLEIIYMNEPSEVIADAILAAGWRKGAE